MIRYRRTPFLLGALALALGSPTLAQRPPDIALNANINRDVVEGVLKALNKYYVSAEVAKQVDENLRERLRRGDYDKITSAFDLIDALDAHMQAVSKDRHLKIAYSHIATPLVEGAEHRAETPANREESKKAARARNFGFEKVARLPGNIGHLDMRSFERPEFSGEMTAAAMTFLANTDALIIDLRSSAGGSLDMVHFLASYFFAGDEPFHLGDMQWRTECQAQQFWTFPYVPGARYVDKDVYILLSKSSFSAPEGFASFLQHHKRAIVVGEHTKGGTHPGMRIKVHANFAVFVPMGKPIYPSGEPKLVLGR